MLKARKIENGVRIFDTQKNASHNFSETSWEIIKAVKKNGADGAVKKIMNLFDIDEKNAKEDISTVLSNLKTLGIKIDDIPDDVSSDGYAPRMVQFDVTPRCNSKCIYCFPSDKMSDPTELSTEQILSTITELSNLETWVLVISGGEPLLRKDIFQILNHAEKLQISTWLLTNGILIDENVARTLSEFKELSMVQVSLDSCISEHHDNNRGLKGAFEKTIDGIKNLLKNGVTPEIEMVVTKNNIDDIEETVAFLNEIGIKIVRIGPALTTNGRGLANREKITFDSNQLKETGKKIIELNKKYARSMRVSPARDFLTHSLEPSSKKLFKCGLVGKSTLYISSNGCIYPCIFLTDPKYAIGDIKKESVSHIWETSTFLKKIRDNSLDETEECKNCDIRYLFESMS